MQPSKVTVPTIGEIARRLGESIHRVEYVVRTRGIRPSGRAGHVRIFTETDVSRIADELRRIDARQQAAENCEDPEEEADDS